MSEENKKRFIRDGVFQMKEYLLALGEAVQQKAPSTRLFLPEHHRWYSFGFQIG